MEIGIALYTIELHGCLNGVYTNDVANGEISSEIAKLKPDIDTGEHGFSGEYDCFYFDQSNSREGWTLTIKAHNTHSSQNIYFFDFIWKSKNGKIDFVGKGNRMNHQQIAVQYKHLKK